uniref:Uncharacterized protein n=1 Tax=Onchocerca volvulus TaxID=6282 RepID=A0A8R1TXW2_ONCVO
MKQNLKHLRWNYWALFFQTKYCILAVMSFGIFFVVVFFTQAFYTVQEMISISI